MATKKIIGDINVQGAIKHNGIEISYEGGSFNIRDKISFEYDSGDDTTSIYFPEGIMPIMFYDDNRSTLYFDYARRRVLASNGVEIADSWMEWDECWVICVPGEWGAEGTFIEAQFMINVGGTGNSDGINTYDLFRLSTLFNKTAPVKPGLSFKSNLKLSDVNVQYKIYQGESDIYPQGEKESFRVISDFSYINGKPALFNPDPRDSGNDLWYTYAGTFTLNNVVYDKWLTEHDPDMDIDIFVLSNRIVEHNLFKHTYQIELNGSAGDEYLFLTLPVTARSEYYTLSQLIDFIKDNSGILTGVTLSHADDVHAQYDPVIVKEVNNITGGIELSCFTSAGMRYYNIVTTGACSILDYWIVGIE